jgi:hypothetical protein
LQLLLLVVVVAVALKVARRIHLAVAVARHLQL